jgi:hypothetical protein
MTLSTSAVAVCCCSDSRSSLSSRVFSIAMTAWSANVRSKMICLSVKGFTSERRSVSTPMASPFRISGTATIVRCPTNNELW